MDNQTGGSNSQAASTQQEHRRTSWSERLPAILFAALLSLGLALALTFSIPSGPTPLRVGDVAKQNVRALQRVSYVSQIKTRQAKDAAAATIPDVYDYDPGVAQQQRAQAQILFSGIANIRADTTITTDLKRDRIQRLGEGIVTTTTTRLILAVDDLTWPQVVTECTRVLDEVMNNRVRQLDLTSIRTKLPSRFSQSLNGPQMAAAAAVVSDLLRPNEIYNASETQKQKKDAQDKIEPVREVVEKGEVVVREGNVVSALDLEKLQALGLQQARSEWNDVLAAVILVLLVVGILTRYISDFQPRLLSGDHGAVLLGAGLLVAVLAGRLASNVRVVENVSLVYFVPFAVLPMLVAMLIEQRLALLVAVVMGIAVGFTSGRVLDVAALVIFGGAVAALRARHIERVGAFFWVGLIIAVVNLAVVLAFYLPSPDQDANALLAASLMALASGGLSAAITAITFGPLGNLLGATTVLHLLELAHPSQPLFRRLLLEAPGTYHHSVIISSLAERAAEAIGADSLLTRVGAYYHDIGKVTRPYFFIENQIDGANVHDTLDPISSAKTIMAHVSDGMELAKKYGLPKRIQDMIPQHHGTKLVGYFYAQERSRNADVREEDFRYTGPKPQTKESAVLMLADGVEAAVRASRDHSQDVMERIVRDIIAAHVADGQLNECNLTLKDLDIISRAFCSALQGVYHPRIAYPAAAGPTQPQLPEGAPATMALPPAASDAPAADTSQPT